MSYQSSRHTGLSSQIVNTVIGELTKTAGLQRKQLPDERVIGPEKICAKV